MTDSINALQYRGFNLAVSRTCCRIQLGDRVIATVPTAGLSASEALRAAQHFLDRILKVAA